MQTHRFPIPGSVFIQFIAVASFLSVDLDGMALLEARCWRTIVVSVHAFVDTFELLWRREEADFLCAGRCKSVGRGRAPGHPKNILLQPRQSYDSSIRDERYHQTGLGRKRKRRQRIGCGVPVHLVYFLFGTNNVTRRSRSKPKYNNGYGKRKRSQQPSGRFRFICATSAIYNFEQLSPIFS